MTEAEIRRIIQQEIRQALEVILPGVSGQNDTQTEQIQNMYPGMQGINSRPVMHPYGIASRAPSGTAQVTARMGEHIGNRVVLGHRDPNRPNVNLGEAVLYDAYGHQVYLSKSKIQVGSAASANPMVLGDILQSFIDQLLQAVLNASQIGYSPFGPVFLDPGIRTTWTQLKAQLVDAASTNFLSKSIFTERGN